MGREIRKVPCNWEHSKGRRGEDSYNPLYDEDYQTACERWYKNAKKFKPMKYSKWYHELDGFPPDEKYYRTRKWTEEEATHFQMYETVSQGTPVTPVFASKEELVNYLVEKGDFWDQKRGSGGWERKNAENFVEKEWFPSMIVNITDNKMKIITPRDG